jgi:hypothetical protein
MQRRNQTIGSSSSRRGSKASSGHALESHYERYTVGLTSDASGNVAATVPVSPAGLVLAARLTGLQALRDQARIDHVRITIRPFLGTDSEGMWVLYTERDPAAAVVATMPLALDQFEVASGRAWDKVVLDWKPQQPTDLLYGLLNPGTVVLSNIYVKASALPVSIPAAEMVVEAWFTLRGRP